MIDFKVHIPTKLFFGDSFKEEFVSEIEKLGSRVLLITGGGSVKRHGYYDDILNLLKSKNLEVFEFSGIEPNPLASTIDKCVKEFSSCNISSVMAFGGGSVMDASKAISALLYVSQKKPEGKFKELPDSIWHYVLGSKSNGKLPGALPIVTIPTTAATASEVTPFAVISNSEPKGKAPIAYEFLKPTISYLNPAYTTKLPENTTQDGASDILSHVFENYFLGGNDAVLTDRYCESIIQTVMETLPRVLDDPYNENLRGDIMWCSTLALNGMQLAGREPAPFVLHAIEHSMSAVKHELAHGRGLATLYPAYFRWLWNNGRAVDRLSRLGNVLFDIPKTEQMAGLYFIEKFELWLSRCGLLQSAKDLGFTADDFKTIADYTIKVYGSDGFMPVCGKMTAEDIIEILKMTDSQGSLKTH